MNALSIECVPLQAELVLVTTRQCLQHKQDLGSQTRRILASTEAAVQRSREALLRSDLLLRRFCEAGLRPAGREEAEDQEGRFEDLPG